AVVAGLTTGRTAALPPSGGLNFPCHIAGDRAMRVHRNNTNNRGIFLLYKGLPTIKFYNLCKIMHRWKNERKR
ncbi:hypothetical protein, partial [Escherichia fergusonii]|uniref:hypothetical protein n=1 Tax=Escherichia fergusonii TaxID=564 RepID=UPI003B43273B